MTQVSKCDGNELERKLGEELFDKWDEIYETANFTGIEFDNIEQFIDMMQGAYEGIYLFVI